MSYVALEIPERFREYAQSREADVHVDHFWGAEVDGEWIPESWQITLFREKTMSDGRIWVRGLDTPDDIENREEMWSMELDLLDAAWRSDVEEQGL